MLNKDIKHKKRKHLYTNPLDKGDYEYIKEFGGKNWALEAWCRMMWLWSVSLSKEEIDIHPLCHPSNYYGYRWNKN